MTRLPLLLVLAGGLAWTTPALAQEATRQRVPPAGSSATATSTPSTGSHAVPRGAVAQSRADRGRPAQGATPQGVAAGTPTAFADQARPRGGRARGDNPRTGRAVPRAAGPRGDGPRRDAPRTYRVEPRRSVRVYPRTYYGYGIGLGYYYDPYWWGWGYYDPYYPYYPRYPYPGYVTGGGRYDIGSVRLDVKPRDAEVYVNGYYAGQVDDFDGVFQALDLEAGPYEIRIVAYGYEPLDVNIQIQPGRKITYRGDLHRAEGPTP